MVVQNTNHALTPDSLKRFTLKSDQFTLPRYWGTVFELTRLAGKANRSVQRDLNSIGAVYRFAEHQLGVDNLDLLLVQIDLPAIKSILEGFFNSERNRAILKKVDVSVRWKIVKRFVFVTLEDIAGTMSVAALTELKASLYQLEARFTYFSPNSGPSRPSAPSALPSLVVEEVYELFTPGHLGRF